MKLNRKRSKHSRWAHSKHRLQFSLWVEAPRPCLSLSWMWYGTDLVIQVEPTQPELRKWHNIPKVQIDQASKDWRMLVARTIRECRAWIRAAREKHEQN